jgi:GNAT superfamily N-acetyltransferase
MSNADIGAIRQGEGIESATWAEVWDASPDALREKLDMSYEHEGLRLVIRAGKVPSWLFNRMTGVGLDAPAQREQVEAQLDRFLALGVPFGVCLVRQAQPVEIAEWLEARGLVHTTTLARMVRTTDALPVSEAPVTIRAVGREDAELFASTVVTCFGMPDFCVDWFGRLCGRDGWRSYLAFDAGEAVGAGALCVHGRVGWLGFGCTVPSHRGRGIQGALMARRMIDAAELGCRSLQTETNRAVGDEPTPSLDNMKRLGFQMAYERPNYVYRPPSS